MADRTSSLVAWAEGALVSGRARTPHGANGGVMGTQPMDDEYKPATRCQAHAPAGPPPHPSGRTPRCHWHAHRGGNVVPARALCADGCGNLSAAARTSYAPLFVCLSVCRCVWLPVDSVQGTWPHPDGRLPV